VKLKLLLSKLIIALKVIIDFANHFRSAEYGADCHVNLCKTNWVTLTFAERNRWLFSLSKKLNLIWTPTDW